MLQVSELIRFSKEKPPQSKVVLFVWWHRGGIETSQKTLGFIDSAGTLHLDFIPAGPNKQPTFWCRLFPEHYHESRNNNNSVGCCEQIAPERLSYKRRMK